MPPAAIGSTAPRPTSASPQHAHLGPMALPKSSQQPDPKPLPPPEALTKDSRAKERDAVKAQRPTRPPRQLTPRPPRPTPASPQHAHLGPMALPKGNLQPDSKPLPLLKPWQKTPEQKNMMRSRHEGPMPPAALGTTPPTHHTHLTSTRAPRPHGTLLEQPAARSKALAVPEALVKDSRAK